MRLGASDIRVNPSQSGKEKDGDNKVGSALH